MTTNPKKQKKDDSGKRIKSIFGDPQENVPAMVQTSVAVQSLPDELKGKLIHALNELPEEKQIQAVQTLQKEQSSYKRLAAANFKRGKEALVKLKKLKETYQQKKRQLVEKYERKAAEEHAKSLLLK